jgi:hypothetical protein
MAFWLNVAIYEREMKRANVQYEMKMKEKKAMYRAKAKKMLKEAK